jgi:zinc protease
MRLARLLVPLLLFAASLNAAPGFPPMVYEHRVLENGLDVYTIQDRSTPTVAIHVWYRVGSMDDPEGRSGFAHLFEHLMFKSTKNMPAEMMDRLTEDVGGWNNATTLADATAYFEVVPSHYLETLLWAEAERMGSLTVDEANFASERDVVKEEFRFRVLAPPYGRLFYAIERESYEVHPYRRPGIGSIEDLESATLDDVKAFHAAFYRPDNAILIVSGDFDQEQIDGWIDRYFAPISNPEGEIPRIDTPEPVREHEKRLVEYAPNVALPAIALTWHTPPASSDDALALQIAATILGDGDSSRLQQRLVRGEIAQDVYVSPDDRREGGLFIIFAILASERSPEEAETAIREELVALASKEIPPGELAKARNLILTRALRERETSNGKAYVLGESLTLGRDAAFVNQSLSRIQAITGADVQRVIGTYVTEGKPVVITYLDETQRNATAGETE